MALTPKQQLFVREYLKDLNAYQAGIRAGYSENHHRILDSPEVQQAVAVAFGERAKRVEVDADTVLRELLAIATTDANELVEYRRTCCRYCWGLGHRYQYVTEQDLLRANAAFEQSDQAFVDDFQHGGIGFDARREPHEACPECFGEGVGDVFVHDTRLVSPAAKRLYAGVKRTKDGLEVKMHDKSKALELLARHLGMLNDKLDVKGDLTLAARIIESRRRVGD